jgi:hypothetical protein
MDSSIDYDIDEKPNPWEVNQLEDFQFFCCPECTERSSKKATFVNHALVKHPKVCLKNMFPTLAPNIAPINAHNIAINSASIFLP